MRDPGVNQAIQAVGGVTELARVLGIAQPSVSNWIKIPAERVIAVEAATGVSRAQLRPDLYGESVVAGDVDDIDEDRAQEYSLLATLLSRAPSKVLLKQLAQLRGDATPLGVAHAALGEAAGSVNVAAVEREYFKLFIGLGRGDLLPYASYYLTGFLNERPLARLREDLARLGIERADGNLEPEDHAATLCEIMAGLAAGRFPATAAAERELFERHIAPWMGRLFADMENAAGAVFYRNVGTIGRLFLEIEAEAFTLAR
jgi:TorA maturation chaperone TorD/DNA-binding transcriptional regulator YdaS (Cro superfamily)